jgi:hypothetical protein
MSKEIEMSQRVFASTTVMIEPQNGVYQITPILVANDYVAIVPIAARQDSSIIIPDAESTIGIIVGIGPTISDEMLANFPVGSTVKFAPLPIICNLDKIYPFYDSSRIILMRSQNILAAVPGTSVHVIVGPTGPISQSVQP